MPRKVKVVNINDDSTYGDVAEAIVENELAENEASEETETQVVEPEPPKPKARAKRVPKPKAAVDKIANDPEPTPEEVAPPKPRAKRTPKAKVIELPPVVEEPVVKPKAVRKPRAPKQEMHVQQPNSQVPPFPPRLSRTAAREALYHSLASGGLS
jgi:hypothetical protein